MKDRSAENIAATHNRIAQIEGEIPPLRSIQVSINLVESPVAYGIVLVTTLDSLDDFHTFHGHPVHLELLHDVMPRYAAFDSVDFES